MRSTTLLALASFLLSTLTLPAETPPIVDAAFEYGFGAQEYATTGKADKRSARLNHYSRANNLESFILTYQARLAFGDLAYRPGFFYALNPLVIEGANGVRLSMSRIGKYPDLVKRYHAVRPANIEAVVSVVVECQGYGEFTAGGPVIRRLFLKIKPLDFVYGSSRDGKDRSAPVVPLHLKDSVSLDPNTATRFTSEDKTSDDELRKIFAGILRVHDRTATEDNTVNVDIKITWPDFEIEQIAKDFERYEKEGKKAEKDYAFLKDAPQEKPFTGNEEMALPIDASPKPGEAFDGRPTPESKWRAGIRVGDKVIFESENIVRKPKPFDEKKTMFLVQMPDEIGARLINTQGKWIQYEGYSRFILSEKRLVGVPDNLGSAYTSKKEYNSWMRAPMTESEFEDFRRSDQKPPPPPKPEDRPRPSDYNVVEYAWSTYRVELFRGEFLVLDKNNRKVISKETAYFTK
jgi:hypothetical protein